MPSRKSSRPPAIARSRWRGKTNKNVAAAIAQARHGGQGALHFVPFDLGKIDEIPALVRDMRKEFGPLFGLVNNAALGLSGALAMMHNAKIEQMVRLNTLSPIVLTKYVVRAMMADGAGRIINIASIVGFTGASGVAAYAATKASMLGFTRSLAREVGQLGITVNAVAPGVLETDMTHALTDEHRQQIARRSALNRLADVEDVANAVEFLLSDKARNITGTVLTVDAGATAEKYAIVAPKLRGARGMPTAPAFGRGDRWVKPAWAEQTKGRQAMALTILIALAGLMGAGGIVLAAAGAHAAPKAGLEVPPICCCSTRRRCSAERRSCSRVCCGGRWHRRSSLRGSSAPLCSPAISRCALLPAIAFCLCGADGRRHPDHRLARACRRRRCGVLPAYRLNLCPRPKRARKLHADILSRTSNLRRGRSLR